MADLSARTVVYVSNCDSHDIDVMTLDVASGALRPIEKVALPGKPGSATPMAVSPDRRFLYVAMRSQPYSVACYAIDSASGRLTHLGDGPLADSMAYLAVAGSFLLAASYPGHKASVSRIGADGVVGATTQVITDLPNAHSIRTEPAHRYAFVASLGSDTVRQYRFDATTGVLTPNTPAAVRFADKDGPRHFVFHPDGRHVYLLCELSVLVYVLDYDAATGTMTSKQSASYKTPGYTYNGDKWAGADIRLTPDGRFLYACERSTSTVTGFRIAADGTMEFIEQVPTETQPRTIAVDPSGQYLLAAGQLSDHVMVYAIDQQSGRLRILSRTAVGKNPNWIEAVALA
jgi:6-phosphogluconolactonase